MSNKQIIPNTIVLNREEIKYRLADIPKIELGIGRKSKDPVRIPLKKDALQESYDREFWNTVALSVSHSINGKDYGQDLTALHKNVPKYIPVGETHNARDDTIHDILKKGVPNAEDHLRVLNLIHNTYDTSDYRTNKSYLQNKWEPLLKEHVPRKRPLILSKAESHYTQEEATNLPNYLRPERFRLVMHPGSMEMFENHPTKGLRYVGHSVHRILDLRSEPDTDYQRIKKHLSDSYKQHVFPSIGRYTNDSKPVNRYLTSKDMGDYSHITTADESESLAKRIHSDIASIENHPTHLPDFHVYSGVGQTFIPDLHIHTRDAQGNYVFHTPAFISTSLSHNISSGFASSKTSDSIYNGKSISDTLKIKIPGGYPHGMFVGQNSMHPHEDEYLLNKGHTLLIHPKPTITAFNGKFNREWSAELLPMKDSSVQYDHDVSSTQKNIDKALDHKTSTDELSKLAETTSMPSVLGAIAKHPNVHPKLLDSMMRSKHLEVRKAAMLNPKLSNESKTNVILGDDLDMTKHLAEFGNLTPEHRDMIVHHKFDSVSAALAHRSDITAKESENLYQNGLRKTKIALAGNRHTSQPVLDKFKNADDPEIDSLTAVNPNISEDHWLSLTNHTNDDIREAAMSNPVRWKLK